MSNDLNIYYFCNHPYPLVIFHSIMLILKSNNNIKHHLVFSEHSYFKNLNYKNYLDLFESVQTLPYIDYQINFFNSLREWVHFKNKLNNLSLVENSIVFTISYSDLATNLFCKYVKDNIPKSWLIHFTIYGNFLEVKNARLSLSRTISDSFNAFLLKGFPLKTYVDKTGILVERIFFNDPHSAIYQLSTDPNKSKNNKKYKSIYFPIAKSNFDKTSQTKMVLFFGDDNLLTIYSHINRIEFYYKLNVFFLALVKHYEEIDKDIKIYYRPHPKDKNEIPSEIKCNKIELFGENKTAEMLYYECWDNIIASYTVVSTACINSSNYGIPSYLLYKYINLPNDIVYRFDDHFREANYECLVEILSQNDIGKIDKKKGYPNMTVIDKAWEALIFELKYIDQNGSK